MRRRYLFGPVTAAFANQNLHGPRQAGDCLAFDHAGTTDLAFDPADTWPMVCARLPGGWRPDFMVFDLAYTTIPECLWSAPLPLVGWAGDWIFWLDADDRLDDANRRRLKELFAGLRDENAAYVMKCACLPDAETGSITVVDHVRLFRNHPEIRWQYRVHEQILPAIRRTGGEVRWCAVVVQHTGYQDSALRGRKLQRDLRLLHLENAEHPDEPFVLFNLGSVYQELGQTAEALPCLRRSLELSHPSDSIVRKLYALIAQCHRQLDQPEEALAACRAGRSYYADDTELLFLEAMILQGLGDLAGAEGNLRRLVESRPGAHFASVDAGLRGYKARHNLAVIYREQGRLDEAEVHWRVALEEQPGFVPGWLGLGDVFLAQGRWPELEQAAGRLDALPQGTAEAAGLRAQGHLARREFTAAQELLTRTIGRHPQELKPRVLLTHALLQEGRDRTAAEQALRDVLALCPDHAEARHNLHVLLQQRQTAERPGPPFFQTGA